MADDLDHLRASLEACREEQHELDEFISLLAHDLRTPLTSIRGYAQLLMRQRPGQPPLDPATTSGLQTIVEQSDRLSDMTNLLLDVSRIRLGRVALRRSNVDVAHAVRAVVSAWPAERGAPSLEAPDSGLVVSADSARFHQMLRALLGFATDRDGAQLPLRVRVAPQPRDVIVTVEDEGEILAAEHSERLFSQLVMPTSGTGGWRLAHPELYIVRGLAEAHGGRVRTESPVPNSERGLRITLSLPTAVAT